MMKSYFGLDKLQTEILVFEEAESLDLRTDDDGNAPPFPGSPDGRVPDISETFGEAPGAVQASDLGGYEVSMAEYNGNDAYVIEHIPF